ncbi:MAG: hypothetical protein PW790_08435 [Parvibaculaceae bacterium]|nr:hypothetical protein [Parvibaculaceae bacterium]
MTKKQVFRELTLDEMLGDSIVQLLMRRDGVTASEIRMLFHHAARAGA